MTDWLDGVAGPGYTQAIFWTFGALLLLVLVLVIVKMIRSMTFGTFVAGGRNRKTRLAVMDATAVDAHRRLILVRRDDIEHLLLIGGPTDVVVERDIKMAQRRPIPAEPQREVLPVQTLPQPQPQTLSRTRPEPIRPVPSSPRPVERPRPASSLPVEPVVSSRPAPRDSIRPSPAPSSPPLRADTRTTPQSASTSNAPKTAPADDFDDDALLKELEFSLEETDDAPAPRVATPTLDDEMTKLLGELSTPRR